MRDRSVQQKATRVKQRDGKSWGGRGSRRKWTLGENTTRAAEQGSGWGLRSSHFPSLLFNLTRVSYDMNMGLLSYMYARTLKHGHRHLIWQRQHSGAWLLVFSSPSQSLLSHFALLLQVPPRHTQEHNSLWSSRMLGAQVQDCRATPHRPWMLKRERRAGAHAERRHLHFSHWHNPRVLFVPL